MQIALTPERIFQRAACAPALMAVFSTLRRSNRPDAVEHGPLLVPARNPIRFAAVLISKPRNPATKTDQMCHFLIVQLDYCVLNICLCRDEVFACRQPIAAARHVSETRAVPRHP